MLLELIQEEFLDNLDYHTTGFNGVTTKQIVAHIKTKYAKITADMLGKNLATFCKPLLDLSTSIETWIKNMLLCHKFCKVGVLLILLRFEHGIMERLPIGIGSPHPSTLKVLIRKLIMGNHGARAPRGTLVAVTIALLKPGLHHSNSILNSWTEYLLT